MKLGVNVDHIATLREARGGKEPDPVFAASVCESAGCDSIIVHLREDRRHIKERDLRLLKETVKTKLNLEMSQAEEIVSIALDVMPDQVTLVPEKRKELTTEGGLDVASDIENIKNLVSAFKEKDIAVSLFIDPDKGQIQAAANTGAEFIELHTGRYARSANKNEGLIQLDSLINAAKFAIKLGLRVNAGHGLNYTNVKPISEISGIEELNIGHSVISHSTIAGLSRAVKEMLALIK